MKTESYGMPLQCCGKGTYSIGYPIGYPTGYYLPQKSTIKLSVCQEPGYMRKIPPEELPGRPEQNCYSFSYRENYKGTILNNYLLRGLVMGAMLLWVLCFWEHPFAISSDIKGKFHQLILLSHDQPLLRFLWSPPIWNNLTPQLCHVCHAETCDRPHWAWIRYVHISGMVFLCRQLSTKPLLWWRGKASGG